MKKMVFTGLLTCLVLSQGCFIFRPKNKCNTCPNFHSQVLTPQPRS